MTKRKYINFIVEFEDDDFFETDDWKSAFSSFQRHNVCTIYGLPNYDGANYEIIQTTGC